MLGDTNQLKIYQNNKADILDSIQARLARSMVDEDKISKATLGNVAYAMDKINNITRLEREQSTSNVAIAHIDAIRTMEEADREIKQITAEQSDMYVAQKDTDWGDDPTIAALEEEIERIRKTQPADINDDPFEGLWLTNVFS